MQSTTEHVISPATYGVIFAILLGLLLLTVLAAQIAHPLFNIVVAITIASVKALLILVYFMHLRYSSSLVSVIVVAGVAWLILLIGLMFSDFSTRRWDQSDAKSQVATSSPVVAVWQIPLLKKRNGRLVVPLTEIDWDLFEVSQCSNPTLRQGAGR